MIIVHMADLYRFRGFAAPFMSQEEGVAILSLTTTIKPPVSKGWEEYLSCCKVRPDLDHTMSILYDLSQKACDVYISRINAGPDSPLLQNLVDDFVRTMHSFPAGNPAEHALVWSVFLVAMESSDITQQAFLRSFLVRQQVSKRAGNIGKALEHLGARWERRAYKDWTRCLTSFEMFVV